MGSFAITILDVERLERGLRALSPTLCESIRARALDQIEAYKQDFPALRTSPFLDHWEDSAIDHLVERFQDSPCPALQSDGSCGVYDWRPLTCRMMGIPTEDAGIVQGACAVQTSLPLIQLPQSLRDETMHLAHHEAEGIAVLQQGKTGAGEEVLLPYGFLPDQVWK